MSHYALLIYGSQAWCPMQWGKHDACLFRLSLFGLWSWLYVVDMESFLLQILLIAELAANIRRTWGTCISIGLSKQLYFANASPQTRRYGYIPKRGVIL